MQRFVIAVVLVYKTCVTIHSTLSFMNRLTDLALGSWGDNASQARLGCYLELAVRAAWDLEGLVLHSGAFTVHRVVTNTTHGIFTINAVHLSLTTTIRAINDIFQSFFRQGNRVS